MNVLENQFVDIQVMENVIGINNVRVMLVMMEKNFNLQQIAFKKIELILMYADHGSCIPNNYCTCNVMEDILDTNVNFDVQFQLSLAQD